MNMNEKNYEALKLEGQLCFPLYACSREVIKQYTPLLNAIDLTYTQYITMEVLWEHGSLNLKELGKMIYLDSGTLTPVLKTLQNKGYITRKRSLQDERLLIIDLTESGMALKEKALAIPELNDNYYNLTEEELMDLKRLLFKVISDF